MAQEVAFLKLKTEINAMLESVSEMIGDFEVAKIPCKFENDVGHISGLLQDVCAGDADIENLEDYVDDEGHLPPDNVFAQLQTVAVRALRAVNEDAPPPLLPADFESFSVDELIEANDCINDMVKKMSRKRKRLVPASHPVM